MIRSIIAVATALAITGGSAQAYQLLGPGGASCGTWVADQRTAPSMYHLDEAWVLGFLSGAGDIGGPDLDPLRGLDAAAVAAWIDNYCQSHPLKKIVDAAAAFVAAHPRGGASARRRLHR